MCLTSTQVGILVAICSSVVILASIVVLSIYPGLNCFIFARNRRIHQLQTPSSLTECQNRPSTESLCGVVEQYGELYIPPNRQPVHVGLDIITHILVASSVPKRTIHVLGDVVSDKVDLQDAVSAMEQGCAPHLSLRLPPATSLMNVSNTG